MPFQDLPYRHEKRAPTFDDADPARIWQYFEDLELLFQKHSISDNAEKKKATVNYTSVTVERLWKYVPTFSNATRSYEDFKEEIVKMYLEAIAARQPSFADLERLISQRVCTPISSVLELGEFYREFLGISLDLIAKCRLDKHEQACHFLASFEPHLATPVRLRLEIKFPDHCPLDPYKTEDIYDAAIYALQCQRRAPSSFAPHHIASLPTSPSASPAPRFTPPQTACAFSVAIQSPSPRTPETAPTVESRSFASLARPSRLASPCVSSTLAPHALPQTPPRSVHAFPRALESRVATSAALATPSRPVISQHNAPHASVSRQFASPSLPSLAAPAPSQFAPTPARAFAPTTRVTQSKSVATALASTSQPYAPAAPVSRHILRSPTPAPRPPVANEPSLSPISTLSLAQQPIPCTQSEPASVASASPSQHRAPLIFAPRNQAPVFTPSRAPSAPVQSVPQPIRTSPPVPEPVSVALSNIAPESQIFSLSQCASPVLAPRDNAPVSTPSRTPFAPVYTAPQPVRALLTVPAPFPVAPSSTASAANTLSFQQPAPSVFAPRDSLRSSASPLAPSAPILTQPRPAQAFPAALATPSPTPADAT